MPPMTLTSSNSRKMPLNKDYNSLKNLLLKTVQFTKDISTTTRGMAQESRFGQIMPSTRENGEKTKLMAEENSGMLMETSTKVSGKMTKPMDMESTSTSTELNMKATGRTTCKMAKVWSLGKTVASTREATKKA